MKTHINDLFDQMEPEKGNKLDDKIKIEEDEEVKELFDMMQNINKIEYTEGKFGEIYENLSKIILKTYSAKTITKFSLLLNEENLNTRIDLGAYLNNLIQRSPDKDHQINLKNLGSEINNIGWNNTKNITIHGNVGFLTFSNMKSGKVEIDGYVGGFIGNRMSGGEIIVNGNVGQVTGGGMSGGKITINGDTNFGLGENMTGGTIVVNGTLAIMDASTGGGNIYEYDKQIVKNGEIIDERYKR